MPRTRKGSTPPPVSPPVQLVIPHEDTAERIENQIVKGTELSSFSIGSEVDFKQAEKEYTHSIGLRGDAPMFSQ